MIHVEIEDVLVVCKLCDQLPGAMVGRKAFRRVSSFTAIFVFVGIGAGKDPEKKDFCVWKSLSKKSHDGLGSGRYFFSGMDDGIIGVVGIVGANEERDHFW